MRIRTTASCGLRARSARVAERAAAEQAEDLAVLRSGRRRRRSGRAPGPGSAGCPRACRRRSNRGPAPLRRVRTSRGAGSSAVRLVKGDASIASGWRVRISSSSGAGAHRRPGPSPGTLAPVGADPLAGEGRVSDGVEHVICPSWPATAASMRTSNEAGRNRHPLGAAAPSPIRSTRYRTSPTSTIVNHLASLGVEPKGVLVVHASSVRSVRSKMGRAGSSRRSARPSGRAARSSCPACRTMTTIHSTSHAVSADGSGRRHVLAAAGCVAERQPGTRCRAGPQAAVITANSSDRRAPWD